MMNADLTTTLRSSRPSKALRSAAAVFGLACCISLSAPASEARAEKVDLTIVHETEASARALQNTVRRYDLPDYLCSAADRTRRENQLDELESFVVRFEKRISEAVIWSHNVASTPLAAHYEAEAWRVGQLVSLLAGIRQTISENRERLAELALKDCSKKSILPTISAQQVSNPISKDPLAGVIFFEPTYYATSAPAKPARICSEQEKQHYVIAVASARANAGFNMNQADGAVHNLEDLIERAKTEATRKALIDMLPLAQRELEGAIRELDELDELYEEAQSLAVVDCSDEMETAIKDPIHSSSFTGLGTGIYEPNLQEVSDVELPQSVCNTFEREQLAGKISAASNRALNNSWEWMKRRTSIRDALSQGTGNEELLLQAKAEADNEIQNWQRIQETLASQEMEAGMLPIVDCKTSKDLRTSMSSGSPESRLLAAIQDSMAQSPYQASGGVALPDPYAADDLAFEAEYALRDRQDDLEYMERYLEEQQRLEDNRAEAQSHFDRLRASQVSGQPKTGVSKDGVEEIIPTAAQRQSDVRYVPVTQGTLDRAENSPAVKDVLNERGNNTRVNQPNAEKPKIRTGPNFKPVPIEAPSVNTGSLPKAVPQQKDHGGGMKQIVPPPMVLQKGTQAKGAGSAAGNPDLF